MKQNYSTSLLYCLMLSAVLMPASAIAQQTTTGTENPVAAEEYYDTGNFHYAVTTQSREAQTWFDRGLAMCIAFNHEEAVRCFQHAIESDPAMPMAYWGLAYAMGPNINNLEIESHQIAQASFALQLAKLHSKRCSDLERGLIAALAKRYPTPVPAVDKRNPANTAYADEMRELHSKQKNDSLVAALHAEALMILRPWNHWTKDGQPCCGDTGNCRCS